MNLYRIFYSDGNDRDELGRVNAENIDKAIEYALTQYFKPDLEYDDDAGDNEHLYLRINSCKYCDKTEIAEINDIDIDDIDSICEFCEVSEYIEIMLDNDSDHEYKTIFGVNEYADLSTDTRPQSHNETLVKAWNISPQHGVNELMYQTVKDLDVISIDPNYLREIVKTHKEITEK